MTLLKQALLIFLGFCSGSVIAAGVFAFLAIIGVFPRLIGKTKTRNHILLYETAIVLGGTTGNLMDLFRFPVPGGTAVLGIFGLAVGVFIGCLIMSLAETLKTLPVIVRRIHLAVGFQYLVLGIALGKCGGALLYFFRGMGP